jgi:hypothetical protein
MVDVEAGKWRIRVKLTRYNYINYKTEGELQNYSSNSIK